MKTALTVTSDAGMANVLPVTVISAFLYNCTAYKDCDLSAKGDLNAFTDGDSVQECANRNSPINGYDGGTLEPAGTTTRAQAASILMRFGQNVVEK